VCGGGMKRVNKKEKEEKRKAERGLGRMKERSEVEINNKINLAEVKYCTSVKLVHANASREFFPKCLQTFST
jgi:hypothetical protein